MAPVPCMGSLAGASWRKNGDNGIPRAKMLTVLQNGFLGQDALWYELLPK